MKKEKGTEQVVNQQTTEILQAEEQVGTSNNHLTEEKTIVNSTLYRLLKLESEASNMPKGNQVMEEYQ